MADKTPVRVVFNNDNVATGMAEFQSGETVGVTHGGTGLSSLGSSLQVLRVNAAGNALEFGTLEDLGDIGSIGSTLTAPSNADFTITTAGTGNIILNDLSIIDNTLTTNRSNDDLKINASGSGTVVLENLKVGTSGATVTTILDEDAMGSDSATALATQQSIKAYVDNEVGNVSTTSISQGDSNVTVADSGTGNITIEVDGTDRITTVAATTTTATGHSLVIGAASNSAGGQIKFLEGTDNGTNGVTVQGPSSTADVTVTLPSSAGTLALTSDITFTASSTDTLTNKTFDVEGTGNSISNIDVADLKSGVLDTDLSSVSGSDDTLASAKAIKSYVDSQVTAQDLDFSADDSTVLSIDLDSEVLHFAGGNGISTSVSNNTVTHAIDTGTVVTLSDSQTLTNKVLTNPTINAFSGTGNGSITGTLSIDNTTTDDSLLITSTEDSNSAGPVITLKRNSGSPADADYLGRINFKGENDADQAVTYARISGKILDASDGTEDGAIEFNTIKNGSSTISARLNSDELKLLNGTTLDVDGAGTFAGSVTATSITTNDIASNGSNADITIAPAGTGNINLTAGADVVIPPNIGLQFTDANEKIESDGSKLTITSGGTAFALPTADGTDGQALVTDGAGTLSFGTVGSAPVSDDTAAVVINDKIIRSTARTIDSFHTTFQDSVLYYVVSNDFNEDCLNVQKVSVCHNDTTAFISSAGAQSKASTTMTAFTTSVDNSMVRVKAASSNAVGGTLSFYKFGLGDNTSTGTNGNIIISQNTDVDSASESLVTFAHATFRGAKLFISVNNNSKTEVGNTEALVVHDGTDAFITQFGGIQTGSNELLTLTAAISGSNVVVSAAGLEPNLRVTVHAIMLKDTMTSNDGTYSNAEAIAPVTISSSATAFDELVETTANGAVYYLVSKNATEGEYAVNEVFFAMGGGDITVVSGAFVSTKGTNQLAFTADYKTDVENTGRLILSSTSGGSTTVSGYRINALAK